MKFGDPITPKQLEYILQMAIDLNFTIKQRDAHIHEIVDRAVKPDALYKWEASNVITKFREWLGRED